MDDRTFHSRLAAAEFSDEVARRIAAPVDAHRVGATDEHTVANVFEDAAYICDIDVTATPLPSIEAIGSVIRRASLTATAVHACELASSESRIRRQSWIGHGSEARA